MTDNQSLNDMITAYLKQKGFKNAAEALSRDLNESRATLQQYAADQMLDKHTSILKSVLTFNMNENSPDWYTESYRYLRRWIESSLDIYKVGLRSSSSSEWSRMNYKVFCSQYSCTYI